MDLRKALIKLAREVPTTRRHLVSLICKIAEIKVDPRDGSLQEYAQDPHGQVYDTYLLSHRNGSRLTAIVKLVMEQHRSKLRQMSLHEAASFVDAKVMEKAGKKPNWHFYSMPD